MAKLKRPVIVSANHLLTGETIYMTATGWSVDFSEVLVGEPAEADAMLARAKGQGGIAVGPEVSEVVVEGEDVHPAHRREAIRRDGPTVGALNPDITVRHARIAARRAA